VPSASPSELHSNDDFCFICKNGDGTLLVCCDKCEHAFHEECLGVEAKFLPDTWFCELCCTLSADESNEEGESSEGGVPSAPPSELQLRMTRSGQTIGKKGFYWSREDECHLLNWYDASCFVNIPFRRIDYSEIAIEIGRSERACRDKLSVIVKSEVLTQQVMREMMNVFQNYEYSQDVPSNMRLAKLASVDNSKNSFLEQQASGASAFHLTQVHSTQMSHFNKALFIQLNPNLQIDENENNLLDSLDGKQCVMADNYIRQPGVHNFEMNPNPHLKHPTTGDFRINIHNKTYLCNFLFFALNKYRTAGDRERWYNYGRSARSDSCYLYIVRRRNNSLRIWRCWCGNW
jgi:hypothetical protein